MLFLLFLPVVGCVALFWRYLQVYAPSNVLVRHVLSAAARWRTVPGLLALAAGLLVAMKIVCQVVERGGPGWLNLVVLVLAWDSIKIALLACWVGLRWATERTAAALLWTRYRWIGRHQQGRSEMIECRSRI